jgi:hypothetical protein
MTSIVLETWPLGFPWRTRDPFLFCVHHDDAYPAGNEQFGPAASLAGRKLGQDFAGKDGWRMYHGQVVPGFPPHPHRGFETVTIVRRGFIDHSDSLGATARFGSGDVQWLTAGAGIVHAEMFPLLQRDAPNPVELFQIWLNLPAADKFAPPHFAMLWDRDVPEHVFVDARGRKSEVRIVAGQLEGRRAPTPPPHSWAARPESDVAIWTIRMEPGATLPLTAAAEQLAQRTLYFFRGEKLRISGEPIAQHAGISVRSDVALTLEAGEEVCELLLLQGRPIDEPVVQYGPFVVNSQAQVQDALRDYERTGFGGWPWSSHEPVHEANAGRFAKHADGRIERADR